MAGHNKWSKVKHIKAVVDAKRGKAFSKFSKELTIAAKLGGSNPDLNARLRSAILNARAQNMPNDNIERAVKKGAGELEGVALEEIVYEGYGHGGAALMVEVVTDNRNRSHNDLRVIFNKNGGTLADAGSVAYQFQRRGEIRLDKNTLPTEDAAMELALETGGDDVVDDGDGWILYTAMDQLFPVTTKLQQKGVSPVSSRLIFYPNTLVSINDEATAQALLKLYDALDDYDDTQHVHSNFEIADDILANLA